MSCVKVAVLIQVCGEGQGRAAHPAEALLGASSPARSSPRLGHSTVGRAQLVLQGSGRASPGSCLQSLQDVYTGKLTWWRAAGYVCVRNVRFDVIKLPNKN